MNNSSANTTANAGAIIDKLLDALTAGNIEAVRACCTEDVVFWHCFDQIAQNFEDAARGFEQFFAGFPERLFVDARRASIPGGFMQQHLMVGTTTTGKRVAWPICVVVKVRDGLIERYDEYIDRAGSYPVADGDFATRGL
jgi:ketosteroid isomerase-like protein